MSGSPEEVNKVLDVVNRTEYMREYTRKKKKGGKKVVVVYRARK